MNSGRKDRSLLHDDIRVSQKLCQPNHGYNFVNS